MTRAILLAMVAAAISMVGRSPVEAAEKKSSSKTARPTSGQPANGATGDATKDAAPGIGAPAGKKTETAIFAGGCFWCMEFAFEQLVGVVDVESGYCGGTRDTADYDLVHLGTTAHAEAIRVTYDPEKIKYDDLLKAFFDAHDPTQLNRQGDDEGRQYRSAIFFANEDQQKQAKAKIDDLNSKHVFKRRIVTKLEPLKEFYPAEDYHQNFARRNPLLPYIQGHAVPKAMNVRTKHPDLIQN